MTCYEGGYNMFFNNKVRKGFTLSEVLITLSIIGVVATLTLPKLVDNWRERAWNTADKMFVTRLSDAINSMAQTGKLEGYQSTKEFLSALNTYMQVESMCDPDELTDCFAETIKAGDDVFEVKDLTSSAELGQSDFKTEVIGFKTNFGVNALLAYDKRCHVPAGATDLGTSCVAYIIDTNSNNKPDTLGKDIRAGSAILSHKKDCKDIAGIGCLSPAVAVYSFPTVDCSDPTGPDAEWCSGVFDSSLKKDYWATAMKACDGKLINSAQTRQLVNYIYGVDNTPDIWAYNWEAYAANPGAHYNDATQANGINVPEYTPAMANRMAEIGLTGGHLILQDLDTRMCNKMYNKDFNSHRRN